MWCRVVIYIETTSENRVRHASKLFDNRRFLFKRKIIMSSIYNSMKVKKLHADDKFCISAETARSRGQR